MLQPLVKNRLHALRTIALTFAVFIGGQIAGVSALSFIGYALGKDQQTIAWAFESHAVARFLLILFIEFFTVYFIYLLLKRQKKTLGSIGLNKRPAIKQVGKWVIKGYAVYFVIFIAVISIVSLTGLVDTDQAQQLGYTNPAGYDLMWAFLSLVILPPIAEEIVFRGYLFSSLKKYITVPAAGIVVSVLFAVAHLEIGSGTPLNYAAALDTLVLSLVLVYVTQKSGSLWPAIGIHALKNLIAFMTLFVLK